MKQLIKLSASAGLEIGIHNTGICKLQHNTRDTYEKKN